MRLDRNHITFGLYDVECPVCDTTMIWSDEFREWQCPQCGNAAWQDETCGPDELYYEQTPDGMDDDEEDGEEISVYEAAEIWESSGRDEDQMFGYTEEELEAAL